VSLNALILVLRLTAAGLLYLFLLGIVIVMWRDWRAVARQVAQDREVANRSLGQLVVVTGGEAELIPGQTFPINVVTGFGRAMTNTVVIEDSFASLEHARLSLRTGRWWLEDLGSTNGTRLNGEPLSAPAIVATGDEIGIGRVRLRIELENA
jgi:pSer/pThr/pTyr-binding forkhead associated (FHA) protein